MTRRRSAFSLALPVSDGVKLRLRGERKEYWLEGKKSRTKEVERREDEQGPGAERDGFERRSTVQGKGPDTRKHESE